MVAWPQTEGKEGLVQSPMACIDGVCQVEVVYDDRRIIVDGVGDLESSIGRMVSAKHSDRSSYNLLFGACMERVKGKYNVPLKSRAKEAPCELVCEIVSRTGKPGGNEAERRAF